MSTLIVVGLLVSTPLGAQQLAPPSVETPQLAPQTLGVREGLVLVEDPGLPARGWATRPDADGDAELPGVVSTHGPGVRIATAADLTVFRPDWTVTGEFTVSALFQRQPEATVSAAYGLTVGGERGIALLVRPDGAFAVGAVGATEAAFVVNGHLVMTISLAPGQLDGVLGVHVGAQADVAVAGFSVQSAAGSITANTGK